MKKTIIILIIAVLIIGLGIGLLILNGIGSKKSTPETNTPNSINQAGKTYNIEINNFKFVESNLQIKKGDTVIWTNYDSVQHTVTSDIGSELNSELFGKNKTYTHTFNNIGTYNYHCIPHPMMKATIIVE